MRMLAAAGQNMLGGMSSALDMVLLLMLAFVGVYGLYTVIRLKKTYMLFPNKFLYPTGCTPETCLDEGGYIDFILPRLTILSVVCLILAGAYGVRIYVFPEVRSLVIELATVILPAGILFWYALIQNKVSKTFW
ncbi:MAG: hypothetical protein IKM59_00125 [Oscillospiraceae bacterium]|nr:hypothetical protein [Oscillospiraceae bacterium]